MLNLKDVSFKVKVQVAFFVIAAISTVMVVNDLYHFFQLSRINNTLTNKIIVSRGYLTNLQSDFQELQLQLLKFSIPGFEDQFETNFQSVDDSKKRFLKL